MHFLAALFFVFAAAVPASAQIAPTEAEVRDRKARRCG
jgi:hypothetical protein